MTVVAPEGHRAKKELLTQGLVPQQLLLQGKECLIPAAERGMDQDLPTTRAGDQRVRLAWARRSVCSAAKLEIYFSQV